MIDAVLLSDGMTTTLLGEGWYIAASPFSFSQEPSRSMATKAVNVSTFFIAFCLDTYY